MTSLCGVWWCYHTITFHDQYLPQVKERLRLLKDLLYLKKRSCLHLHPLARNLAKQILQPINNQVNELELLRRWNQWKHWVKWQLVGAKFDDLHIFQDLKVWTYIKQFLRWSWTPCLSPFGLPSGINYFLSLLSVFNLPVTGDEPPLFPRKRNTAKCCGIVLRGPLGWKPVQSSSFKYWIYCLNINGLETTVHVLVKSLGTLQRFVLCLHHPTFPPSNRLWQCCVQLTITSPFSKRL